MSAPRIARLLLRLSSPPDRREDTLGDLEEAHRRRVPGGPLRAWLLTMLEACVIALALTWARIRPAGSNRAGRLLNSTDIRLGFRLMYKQPVLTITAVVALAVGMGLATVGFAFMEATQFGRLPFEGGDRFVTLQVTAAADGNAATLETNEFRALSTQATTLEYLGGISGGRENIILPSGQVAVATTAGIAPSLQRYLPYRPAMGRQLTHEDGLPGAAPVAMIRDDFWRNTLAASPQALGSTIEVAGVSRTVVGIVPDAFEFPNSPDLWFPIDNGFLEGRGAPDSDIRLLGVLAPGRSIRTAREQLNTIATQVSSVRGADRAVRMEVTGFTDLGPIAAGLSAGVIAMVLTVLIVIAANVGNLILARSFARSREFALRAALGAARRQLVGQVFLEVLLIAGAAAVIGGLAASVALRYFSQMDEIPFWVDFTGGPRTMLLVAGATVLSAGVAGVWPALRATRRDLAGSLEGGGRASDVRFGRTAGVLVTLQIALSIVMLHGALIFAQGLNHFTGESLPLPRNVLTTYLSVNGIRRAPGNSQRVRSSADDVTRLAASIPGVLAAGIGTALPRHSPRPEPTEVEPLTGARPDVPQRAPSAEVSLGYFDALDASPLAGRLFTAADYSTGAPPVAVVNAPFVEKFLQGTSPIGRRIRTGGLNGVGPWMEIVGVVPDLGLSVGDSTLAAGFYVPLGAETNYVYLALRVTGDPLSYTNALRLTLLEADPGLIINHVQLLEDVAIEDREAFKILSAALVGIGGITLILALAGVYAMMALIVTRRTREIGIRMALGATTTRIVRAIAGRAAWQVAAGAALGCIAARLSLEGRMVLVSRLGDGGAWTLPAVVGLLAVAGLAATWLPLRRALGVRPTDALRAE